MGNELMVGQSGDMLTDPEAFDQGQRVAKLFASSELVPMHLRGKPADCFIALYMAKRMNEDPLTVLQNIHFIGGKAGWGASYMIGRANRSGVFQDQISWDTTGEGAALAVTATATLQNGKAVSATASMAMARAEGWTKNAKYASMPEHMLKYRAATFLIRLYAPEVMMGFPAADENEDVAASKARDVTPPPRPKREDFIEQNAVQDRPSPPMTPPQAEVKVEDSPATKFAIIDADGCVGEFDTVSETCRNLCLILGRAALDGRKDLFDGIWESNDVFLEQVSANDPESYAKLVEFHRVQALKVEPLNDPMPDFGDDDPLALPDEYSSGKYKPSIDNPN